MAPEQATGGRELGGRSHLYSLGAVAYYLLTAPPPFDGRDVIEVMIAHARDPVVPPSRGRADVPEDLERVVLRCLAKNPPSGSRMPRAWSTPWASAPARGIGTESGPCGGGETPTRATAN